MPIVVSLCLLVVAALGLLVAFYRLQGHWEPSSLTGWWPWFVVTILVSLFACGSMSFLRHYRHSRRDSSNYLRLIVSTSCAAFALFFAGAEVMVRLLAEEHPEGPLVGNTILLPRDWTKVAAHRRLNWEQASRDYGLFSEDELLGWTVGRNRKGIGPHKETYFSNEDGLRTVQNGSSLRSRPAALRIALLGDSYTFGEDVSYEDTWGHQLASLMGLDVQVLNFGVPAYGIDQAFLRYLRDARDWHPDIVILSFISHDVMRTGMIYYWIGFQGAAVPGAKPRFILNGDQLSLLNLPLPAPEQVYSTTRIENLPFVQSDSAYRAADWEWHLYQYSYLLRFLVSWPFDLGASLYRLDHETQGVSEAILNSFVRTARAAGSFPIVVFLPEYMEFRQSLRNVSASDLLGRRVAREAGVEFVDLTSCLEEVSTDDRFTLGWHYTSHANGAVARCLHARLTQAYPRIQSSTHPPVR